MPETPPRGGRRRCEACPVPATTPCPAHRDAWAGWCRNVSREAGRGRGGGHWTDKLLSATARDPAGWSLPPPASLPPALPPDGRARVGFLCPRLVPGGAEVWQAMLARSLDPARLRAEGCVALSGPGDPAMVAGYRGVCPVAEGFDAARELAARCDVLATWGVRNLPDILAGLARRPYVIAAVHSTGECAHARDLYARPGGVDRWVAVSEIAREAVPPASLKAAPISVIENAVDPTRLAPGRCREEVLAGWGIPPGALVAGFYGRLSGEKGPEAMIALASHLPAPWHVAMVGPDQSGGTLAARSRHLPRLRWVGPDPRAGEVLRAIDVLVIPSKYESHCLTMAEGIEVGTPVVSTGVGLAKLIPGLTRPVPFDDDGTEAALQVQAAIWEGRPPGQLRAIAAARPRWQPERFTREWSDLLASMGAEHASR